MNIETPRLLIRDLTDEDIDSLYKIKYSKGVLEYIPTFIKRDATLEDIEEVITYCISVKDTNNFDREVYFAVVEKNDNNIVGILSVSLKKYLNETQIGWMILSEHIGKGYASESARTFSDYLLKEYEYDYLIVTMDIDNPASFRTAQKSGFKLFEQRSAYDYFYSKINVEKHNEVLDYYNRKSNEIGSCYFYFRKYNPNTKNTCQFYGDTVYDGRHA